LVTTITTELIFTKLQQEKNTGELTTLQSDFYSQANTLLSKLNAEAPAETSVKQLENAQKMLFSLRERRKQKLLMYVAYDKPLPAPVPEEEETLYNEIRQIIIKDNPQPKASKIKITNDIPEVLTAKGRKIGPYKRGEVVEVTDTSDAEFIIKNKIGETE
jgi:DNA replication initiation complex subunit (GINS family)